MEVPYRGDVNATMLDVLGGLRSACTYVGAGKLKVTTCYLGDTSRFSLTFMCSYMYPVVLRSQNYLFSAPAPPLSLILALAPAPAPAIYCHLKLFGTIPIEVEISFSSS